MYTVCDSDNGCSNGTVYVTLLPVNDDPRFTATKAAYVPYPLHEDRLNEILTYYIDYDPDDTENATDWLGPGEGSNFLALYIITNPSHGVVSVNNLFAAIGYTPELNYVGLDSLMYMVCDQCSNRRNAEFGRLYPSTDPACIRQRIANPTVTEFGCFNVTLPIKVLNTPDPGQAVELALLTPLLPPIKATFSPLLFAFDNDQFQIAQLRTLGANRTDLLAYAFTAVEIDAISTLNTTIDRTSVTLQVQAVNGVAVLNTTTSTFIYTPNVGFVGYDVFTYGVCDITQLCTTNFAHVHVLAVGPTIIAVRAVGACVASNATNVATVDDNCVNMTDTDAGYGPADRFVITFSEPTNMPPYRLINTVIDTPILTQLLDVNEPLTRQEDNCQLLDSGAMSCASTPPKATTGYYGMWRSSTELLVIVTAPGYPNPTINPASLTFNVKTVVQCSTFNVSSQVYVNMTTSVASRFCLTNAAQTSAHNGLSVVGGVAVTGSFGRQLPTVTDVSLTNPVGVSTTYFGLGSHLDINISPPLTPDIFYLMCNNGYLFMFISSIWGVSVNATMACTSTDNAGNTVPLLTPVQFNCLYNYTKLSTTSQVACNASSTRRMVAIGANANSVNRLSIDITHMSSTTLNPSQALTFFTAMYDSFNLIGISTFVAQYLNFNGTSDSVFQSYTRLVASAPQNRTLGGVRIPFVVRGQPSSTPRIVSAVSEGTAPLIISILITFNANTNALATDGPTVTQTDLDKMLTFTPKLSLYPSGAYSATWTSRSTLLVSLVNASYLNPGLSTNPTISFFPTQNRDLSPVAPADNCVGYDICGKTTGYWGICDEFLTSCRSSTAFPGSMYTAFVEPAKSSTPSAPADISWWWYLLLIMPFFIIIFVLYYFYQKKNQKKDISRVLRAWRAKARSSWSPKDADKEAFKEPEVWSRPPAVTAMRRDLDPFSAVKEVDNDPAFAPRAPPNISALPHLPLNQNYPKPGILPVLRGLPGQSPAMRLPPLQGTSAPLSDMSRLSMNVGPLSDMSRLSMNVGAMTLNQPMPLNQLPASLSRPSTFNREPAGTKVAPVQTALGVLPPPNIQGLRNFSKVPSAMALHDLPDSLSPQRMTRPDPFNTVRRTSVDTIPIPGVRRPSLEGLPTPRPVDPFSRPDVPGATPGTALLQGVGAERRRSSVSMPQRPTFGSARPNPDDGAVKGTSDA